LKKPRAVHIGAVGAAPGITGCAARSDAGAPAAEVGVRRRAAPRAPNFFDEDRQRGDFLKTGNGRAGSFIDGPLVLEFKT
jgi:hypothetical protein